MLRNNKISNFIRIFFYCLIPLSVMFSVWIPIIQHNYITDTYEISNATIASLRLQPDDALLKEIGGYGHFVSGQLSVAEDQTTDQTITIANSLLQGIIELHDFSKIKFSLSFNPKDLQQGSSSWQLRVASFIIPRLLLVAYASSGDEKYFTAARDYIFKWRDYEQSAWLPSGFLWNDHAMAGRVAVLTNFWRFYRNHPSYDADEARKFLKLVIQTGARLADPEQFTFATNHGIMQNLALLHLSLGFPAITKFYEYQKLATDRLTQQLKFYINDEGVVLEHSAEYHKMGVELLGLLLRYFTLLKKTIPEEWISKYEKSKAVYASLNRPDDSLPRWGDTSTRLETHSPAIVEFDSANTVSAIRNQPDNILPSPNALYPAAGLSIWWEGLEHWPVAEEMTQTFMTWSYYPGHGHKHADELSIMFWAAGENWWTNAGYWPYDDTDGRNKAISWAGSNAPHLIDEATDSARHSTLLGSGWSSELAIIDVERQGTEGFTARRQLVHIQPNIWLFIDSFQDTLQRQVRTIWTTDRDISVAEGYVPGSFVLTKSDKDTSMLAYFTNNTATFPYVKIFKGSTEPFAGLVEVEGAVYPAPAFVVEQPSSNSWSLVVSMLNEPSQKSSVLSEEPRMLNWSGAQKWELEIPVKQGDITISRSDNLLSMSDESMSDGSDPQVRSLSIRSDFDVSDSVSMVQQAYLKTANSYPSKFYDLISYRLRATYILIALFVLQEVFFLIIGFVFNQRHRIIINVLRIFSILTWLIIGWWLSEIYFSTIDTTFLQAILGIIKPI